MKRDAAERKKTKKATNPERDVDRMYNAVNAYVKKRGGKIIVIGGVQIQEWPTDAPGVFRVAVSCLGTKPTFAERPPRRAARRGK